MRVAGRRRLQIRVLAQVVGVTCVALETRRVLLDAVPTARKAKMMR